MDQILQQKKGLVKDVFNKVFKKYDLMNDLMSLGIHRIWKKNLIQMMNPSQDKTLIDVACGTGDVAKLFLESTDHNSKILCVDPNRNMINECKKNLKNFKNVKWKTCSAEKLNVPENSFDFYTISFGLRNTKDIDKSLKEAFRVLKKGGRFFCLEFSKIENDNIEIFYRNYSKLIPNIGELIVGERKPYEYLVKSIENFITQKQLINKMEKNNFINCKYRNLNGGIVAIHSGWKI
tara:strand:+ start:2708 stop:3412 length:705 start_codon:yes stop_codon:yes gene_type:complete